MTIGSQVYLLTFAEVGSGERKRRRRRRRTSVNPRVINDVGVNPPSSLFIGPYNGSFPLRELPRWKAPV